MKFIEKNLKWITLVIILIIIASSVSVYAAAVYFANQVEYKDGKSVASALDDLYARSKLISKNIEDFSPEIKYANGTYITVKVPNTVSNNPKVVEYIYLLNGKIVDTKEESEYTYKNLEMGTSYSLSVIAVEEDGSVKCSESVSSSTINKLYIYDAGNECTPITGGWLKTGYDGTDSGTITKNSNYMYIYAPNGSRIFCGTANKINLANYTKLYIQTGDTNQELFQISGTSYYNRSAGSDLSYGNSDYYNISSYNGEYYIHFTNANNSYQNIQKVWLEE